MDLISELLGIDNGIEEISETIKEQAQKVVKLTEEEEWKIIDNYLQLQLDKIKEIPVEQYSQNPELAHYYSGKKHGIEEFVRFIQEQKNIVEKLYGKESKGA